MGGSRASWAQVGCMAAWLTACLLAGWLTDWLAPLLACWVAGRLAAQPLGGRWECLSPLPIRMQNENRNCGFLYLKSSDMYNSFVQTGFGVAEMTSKSGSVHA